MYKMITKIEIDLSEWSTHYPTGATLYNGNEVVDSDWCDTVAEFKELIDRNRNLLIHAAPHATATEVIVIFNGVDLIEYDSALECAKEVVEYIYNIIY